MSDPKIKAINPPRRSASRIVPVLVTLGLAGVAAGLLSAVWSAYMGTPWTRDGAVRAYVVTLAPEVTGRVVGLPVADNQFVHKGDLVMKINPEDYAIALKLAQATVDQAKADLDNKAALAARREKLSDLATTPEERQTYVAGARIAQGVYDQQLANLERARVNLQRTEIRAPVNGWVTNLLIQQGDYATAGQNLLSLVDADSFWVDGYFEETVIGPIREGDPARVWLLGYGRVLQGHVEGLARAIVVGNAQAGQGGLATVNPVFTWVRLAQRVPVRIRLDKPPKDLRLVAGMTATVAIDPTPVGKPAEAPAAP